MRITNSMMTNSMITNINTNMNTLNNRYTQMSTGKKIQKPSEDPIISSRALKFRSIVSSTAQYTENTKQANSWMETTEAVYKNVNSILTKMDELSIQGATDSYSLDERKKILNEFNSLTEQLEGELNSTYMGRYIFSGYKTDQAPIIKDDTTGKNILNPEIYGADATATTEQIEGIDGQAINLEVGVNNYIEINSTAPSTYTEEMYNSLHEFDRIYDYLTGELSVEDTENYFGGVSFSDLSEGEKTNFDKELRSKFESMIANVQTYSSSITEQHTDLGVRMNRLSLIQSRLSDDKLNYTSLMSSNENIELSTATMEFNVANVCYQAALKVGMSITQLTLADYL